MLTIILTSVLIALIFAPLGCIALWKKYVYFGDGLAHASILAGSISLIFNIPMIYSGIITALIFAILVFKFKNISGTNAVVNLISSLMLSVALILAVTNPSRININQLLFGDIISTSFNDLITLSVILLLVYIFITIFYKQILLIVLNPAIAFVKGVRVNFIELSFLILLSISVFSSIKIVGSLLVTSILIIPAMSARLISITPFKMIIISISIALFANLLGLYVSFYWDIPIAPVIIVTQCGLYLICYLRNIYKKTSH
jgi:zinc transport system permease protein